ncbi:MAG: hypothetical protein EXQ95_11525 [Alphaproteobacteria bacterium]|nr:hypothetical protein [Alphaproteobacteria bacterium]
MTNLMEHAGDGFGGRYGRLALRVALAAVLASPIAVGFWLAPKADDMPPPPELTAPPSVTSLPDAARRVLPAAGQDRPSETTLQPAALAGGG